MPFNSFQLLSDSFLNLDRCFETWVTYAKEIICTKIATAWHRHQISAKCCGIPTFVFCKIVCNEKIWSTQSSVTLFSVRTIWPDNLSECQRTQKRSKSNFRQCCKLTFWPAARAKPRKGIPWGTFTICIWGHMCFWEDVKQFWKLCQQYFTKFRPHHPEEICGRHFKKLQSVNQRPLSCTANQRQPLLCTAIFGSSHALKSTKQSWKLCQQYFTKFRPNHLEEICGRH